MSDKRERWMTSWLSLETAPPDEKCAQLGTDDYYNKARKEANEYIKLIRSSMGPEPKGVKFVIKMNPHDFGSYVSLDIDVAEDDEEALEYALRVESDGPMTWAG